MASKPYIVHGARALAEILGVDVATVQRWKTVTPPIPQIGRRGNTIDFDLREVIQWWAKHACGVEKDEAAALKRAKLSEDLETARRKRQKEMGQLIPLEHVAAVFSLVASHIKGAGESLAREHGIEAQRVLLEALEEIEAAGKDLFETVDEQQQRINAAFGVDGGV